MGQRLQRQGDAWRQERDAWINYQRTIQSGATPEEIARVSLGCDILIGFCDLLHADMFRSNSESLEIRNRSRTLPSRDYTDCSLLLSVTDPDLPEQPGSGGVRYWFPPERQCKQPQTEEPIPSSEQASSPLLISADLQALLEKSSFDDLQERCKQLQITPFGKLNRLRMAESILFHTHTLFHQSARISRHQPELKGKVFSFMVCRVVTVLTSVIPHR